MAPPKFSKYKAKKAPKIRIRDVPAPACSSSSGKGKHVSPPQVTSSNSSVCSDDSFVSFTKPNLGDLMDLVYATMTRFNANHADNQLLKPIYDEIFRAINETLSNLESDMDSGAQNSADISSLCRLLTKFASCPEDRTLEDISFVLPSIITSETKGADILSRLQVVIDNHCPAKSAVKPPVKRPARDAISRTPSPVGGDISPATVDPAPAASHVDPAGLPAGPRGQQETQDEDMQFGEEQEAPAPPARERTIPFFVKLKGQWTSFYKEMNSKLAAPAKAVMVGEEVKITVSSSDDFRTLQQFLTEGEYDFAFFDLKADKPKKLAIRGIPGCVPTTEIVEALAAKGFAVKAVYNLKNRKTGAPLNVFQALMHPNDGWESIYRVTDLLNLKISIKSFETKGIRQCFRCNRFQHSSFNCHFEPRCVKCAGNHLARGCPNSRDTPPLCCNCGGQHTANFSGCSARPGQKRNPKPARNAPKRPEPSDQPDNAPAEVAPPTSVAGPSYAAAARKSTPALIPRQVRVPIAPKAKKRKAAPLAPAPTTSDSPGNNNETPVLSQTSANPCECKDKIEAMMKLYCQLVEQMGQLVQTVNELASKLSPKEGN